MAIFLNIFEMATFNHQPSTFNLQPSTFNLQLSTFNFQPLKYLIYIIVFLSGFAVYSQNKNGKSTRWMASIHRPDSNDIVFTFTTHVQNNKTELYIKNATEILKVDNVRFVDDSVFIEMPVFESRFRAKVINGTWQGVWIKGTSAQDQVLPFTANPASRRFEIIDGDAKYNISGRWQVTFASDKTKSDASIAELVQKGNIIYGTFLTPSGDYRYQEGVVTGNHLKLSGFDGGHAYSFTADVTNNSTITHGMFYSGANYKEGWNAVKDPHAKVITDAVAMHLRPGEEKLDFTFPDLNGKDVSIHDDRFKNKVVIVQILGSWCPNCMDETKFLSAYYNRNKQRGVEIVALAYEYSTNFQRSVASLGKFKNHFNVQYPILITGVKVSDTLRTEKTLPQVTPIKVFPSSILIDKKGKVRKFDTGFFGPGTGIHYEEYKREFYATIDELLNEK
jgi:peroxiredoxin